MKKILSIIVLVACATGMYAQDISSVAMHHSAKPRDLQTLAMGGTSALKNVALRPYEESKFDVNASFAMWGMGSDAKTNDINAALSGKIADKVGLMGTFSMDMGAQYDVVGESGTGNSTFSPKDMLITAGVSYKIISALSLGATFRYMNSSIAAKNTYSAVGADVMLAGSFGPAKVTAGVTNLGSKVKAANGSEYSIPMAITVGGNYAADFGLSAISANAQIDYFMTGGLRAGLGAEYSFKNMLFVRAGYNYGGKSVIPSFVSAGLGAKFGGFGINLAALFGSITTLQFGLGYSF